MATAPMSAARLSSAPAAPAGSAAAPRWVASARLGSASSAALAGSHAAALRAAVARPAAATTAATRLVVRANQPDWPEMQADLVKKGIRSYEPDEVEAMQKSEDVVLLDVRAAGDFARTHAAGAVNVQLFGDITGTDAKSWMKRAVYAVNGIKGVEEDPNFVASVVSKLPNKSQRIAVICDAGGTLTPTPNFAAGKKSRSLTAIWYLSNAGYTGLCHVSGGLREWGGDELPLEGSEPGAWREKAGKAP